MLHEVIDLQPGWQGTSRTVEEAYRLVNDSLVDPVVVTTAQDIVRHLPERDKMAEVRAISDYVKRNIRYTNEGIETLKTPSLMLREIRRHGKAVGDCDDHVILWAALHKAVGNPVRFRVISQRPDQIANHIYGEVLVGRRWIADDLIVKNQPLGWRIPDAEVTADAVYPDGMGGMMEAPMEFIAGMRAVGGGVAVSPEAMIAESSRGGGDYFGVAQKATRQFRMKRGARGSMLTVGPDGEIEEGMEGVGFLPLIAAAASSIAPLVKKLKKPKAAPAPVVVTPAAPQDGMTKYLPYILMVGGGLVMLMLVMRR